MILKTLLRRKTRTLLTIAGVTIGVAAIVILGTLAEGLVIGYGALGTGSGADLLVAQAEAIDIVFSTVDQDLRDEFVHLRGVAEVSEMVYTFASTEGVPYFIVFGYDPDGFAIEHFRIIEGVGLNSPAARGRGEPLILGQAMANDLDKEVGDMLRVYDTTYRIVGIYETGAPFEDGAAVVSIEMAQQISGRPRQVNAFLLKLEDINDTEEVRARIEQRFDDLTATQSSNFAQEQEMLAMLDGFTWGISFMAILIGGVTVMNTMLMSVFERTREFGALRAVGWKRGRVLRLVLSEALVLNGLGGVVGVSMGIAVIEVFSHSPAVSGFLPNTYPPELLAQGIGVALVLGLVGGAYPAWRASKLLPAEAMRSDGSGSGRANVRFGGAALRNLMRQPIRTLLTMTAIGLAMMSVISMGAMAEGLLGEVTAFAGGQGVQLVGMQADASIDLSTIDEGIVRRIGAMDGIAHVEGFLTGYTALGDLPFFIVLGYQPRGYAIRDFRVVEGEPLETNRQIILGRVAAENLERDVGDTLRILDIPFRVVGIYETGVPMQDGGGVISLRSAQTIFGQPHKISFLGIRLDDPRQAEEVANAIETRFPEVAISLTSKFTEDVTDLQFMEYMTWGIAFMALVVGGAGMMNTMVMSVFERTREIGVLRALGWRKRQILGMIMRESLALSLLGGTAGIAAGVGISLMLNQVPIMAGFLKLSFSPMLFIQAFSTALVLGAVGGAYPAWRASRLRPVEALRYE
jgi:ABC-type antimicrobial peptide transport system permease subunit